MTAVTIDIVCPPWCSIDPQQHADQLWETDGEVHHHAEDITVDLGVVEATCHLPELAGKFPVGLVTVTRPDGRECDRPSFYLAEHAMTLDDVKAVQDAITRILALYAGEVVLL